MTAGLSVGGEFFDRIRRNGNYYYADKTEMISKLVDEGNAVSLFLRPRRFGKTLMLSMLDCFFNINKNSKALFKDLSIMKKSEFCKIWMNQYPVLSLTLKDVEGSNYGDAYGMLSYAIANLCKTHAYLRDSEKVLPEDREIFQRLIGVGASREDVANSLGTLMRMLHAHFDKNVIVLIDEYDAPLLKASAHGYYEEMLVCMRSLLGTALKANEIMAFSVLTGVLGIARDSLFAGVNDFASYSVLNRPYAEYFGFTLKDVDELLRFAGLKEQNAVRAWYNGYLVGDLEIICPWDILNYVSEYISGRCRQPKSYWEETGGNSVIGRFLGKFSGSIRKKFEKLMRGGSITTNVTDQMDFRELYSTEKGMWSAMLMMGYLTKGDGPSSGNIVSLKIPNIGIREIYEASIDSWFASTVPQDKKGDLLRMLWNGETDEAQKLFQSFLSRTISYFDYHESFYHGFLAGIFTGTEYDVESNQEQGSGRPDILIDDSENERVIIIEAKWSPQEAGMTDMCREALERISRRRYDEGYEGVYRSVQKYGIAFWEKKCLLLRS